MPSLQLDTTTKRTIAENEQMSSELTWQVRAPYSQRMRRRGMASVPARTAVGKHAAPGACIISWR
eukprot:scaffold26957_cov112-Isochrysis_galbana.AAC.2